MIGMMLGTLSFLTVQWDWLFNAAPPTGCTQGQILLKYAHMGARATIAISYAVSRTNGWKQNEFLITRKVLKHAAFSNEKSDNSIQIRAAR